jgi:hypothetical protein
METIDNKSEKRERKERSRNINRIMGGTVLLIIGGFLLADRVGADLPHWLFTWPMIPIVVGIFIGINTGFRDWGFLIPITVGVIFLLSYNVEGYSFHNLWPVIVIAAGLAMLLNSGRKRRGCQ